MRNFGRSCNIWSFHKFSFKTIMSRIILSLVIFFQSEKRFLKFEALKSGALTFFSSVFSFVALLPLLSVAELYQDNTRFLDVDCCFDVDCCTFTIAILTRLICCKFVWYSVNWFCQQSIVGVVYLFDPFIQVISKE